METHSTETTLRFEVMKMPTISFRHEEGLFLISILLNLNQGEFSEKIQELQNAGVDRESLENLALTWNYPERNTAVMEMAKKYKPHIKNPREVQQKLFSILDSFQKYFSGSELEQRLESEIKTDQEKKLKQQEQFQDRIQKLINFFQPNKNTTKTKKVNFIPVTSLQPVNSGSNFTIGSEQIIKSHIENTGNHKHEFLHGVINPIVDKLDKILTSEQKQKISDLANEKLKDPEDYGTEYYSLLCEELIRTYVDVFSKGEQPEEHKKKMLKEILLLDEEKFQKILKSNIEKSTKKRLEKFRIKTLDDLKKKFDKYYEHYEQNKLRELIFPLYQKYDEVRKKKNINFEEFILEELPKVIF